MHRKFLLTATIVGTAAAGLATTAIIRSRVATTQTPQINRIIPPVRTVAETEAGAEAHAQVVFESGRAVSQNVYTLPFQMAPTAEQMAQECIIIDANNDANNNYNTWAYNEYFGSPLYWSDGSNDADDWLVFPAVKITDPTKVYKVSIGARSTSTTPGKYESFELRVGKTPTVAGLSKVLLSEPVVTYNNGEYNQFSTLFGISESDTYYFAVRCNSSASEGWRLLVRDLKIEATDLNNLIPAEVTNLSATPDNSGKLQAVVSFTMPIEGLTGTALPANELLTATVKTSVDSKTITGKPGEKLTTTLAAADGMNNVTVSVSNTHGIGATASTSVRCGYDIPVAAVLSTAMSADNLTLTVSWDPVTEGVNGGTINPDDVTYDIYRQDTSSESWIKLASDIKETQYQVTVPAGTPLQYCDIAVDAHNSKGGADDIPYVSELIGDPYPLPINETLEGQQLHYVGLTIDRINSNYGARFASIDPAQLDEAYANTSGMALAGMSEIAEGTLGQISLPKFSTMGMNNVQVVLPFFLYAGLPEINVYARTNTSEPVFMGKVEQGSNLGWTNVSLNLPAEFCNQPCVTVSINIKFANSYQLFLLEGYKIKQGVANDMAISDIKINPSTVTPGQKSTVTVTVSNEGMYAGNPPAMTGFISARGTRVADLTFKADSDQQIPMGGTATYTADFTLLSADFIGATLNISASLETPDEVADNNTLTTQAIVGGVATPVVTDLSAQFNDEDGSISLAWSNPMSDDALEDCEFLPTFSYDSKLGVWTNLDFDGGTPYTLGSIEGIYMPDDLTPKAFMVVSSNESNLGALTGIYGANRSDKFLMAFCPQEAAADDWLISPEVLGGSELSFYWEIVSDEFTEKIEILYSTTDDSADSFTHKLGTYTKKGYDWEEVRTVLPEDAKYFAIHYCSNDCFGIMIDDILYTPASGEYTLDSFSVLRDENEIANLPGTATAFTDNTAERDKHYTYHVLPSYLREGVKVDGIRSNPVSIKAAGIINASGYTATIFGLKGGISVLGHNGELIRVFNLQGQEIKNFTASSDSHFEPMPAGFYLVGQQKVIVK